MDIHKSTAALFRKKYMRLCIFSMVNQLEVECLCLEIVKNNQNDCPFDLNSFIKPFI